MSRKICICFFIIVLVIEGLKGCTHRNFGSSSFVCVCNATYCNLYDPFRDILEENQFRIVKSSKDKHRNHEIVANLKDMRSSAEHADVSIDLDTSKMLQSIIGFGGAFTDAAGINIKSLSLEAQENLMKAYFSDSGSAYNLCRLPIAGSDFSTHPYSYDDHDNDIELKYFSLTDEDHQYKLPYIKRAMNLASKELKLIGSPWAPPTWMKTNGKFNESGTLKLNMWHSWSKYIVKFVESYEKELEQKLWGLTPQNEPLSGLEPNWPFNCLGWTATDMRDWIKSSLGPILEKAGLRRVTMMVDDFNRYTLPDYPGPMIRDPESSKYIDGIAVHWYDDEKIGPEVLDQTHEAYPEKFILYTEACAGWNASADERVILGSWERGEKYMKDIIEAVNHWSTGWIDWNLALDMEGGPNWVQNYVDSPVIVNSAEDEFYLQPTYFALNLFSRNVNPGAQRIFFTRTDNENIHITAFKNPDGSTVIILANVGDEYVNIEVKEKEVLAFEEILEPRTWEAVHFH